FRREVRYAVLSSLGAKRYVPSDEDHIGYFAFLPGNMVSAGESAQCPMNGTATTSIAYEELAKEGPLAAGDARDVFVLWIDESELSAVTRNCPLHGLSALQTALRQSTVAPAPRVAFMGPGSSSTLKAMIKELSSNVSCLSRPVAKTPTARR